MKTLHIEDFFAICNWSQTIDFCNKFQDLISRFHDHSCPTYMFIDAYAKNPRLLVRVHANFWVDKNGIDMYELLKVDVFESTTDWMAMLTLDLDIRKTEWKYQDHWGTTADAITGFVPGQKVELYLN